MESHSPRRTPTTGPWTRPGLASVAVFAILLLAGPVLAGCLDASDLESQGEDRAAGFTTVEVSLQTFGDAPANVTAVDFSFSQLALYERTTRQWVQLGATHDVRIDLARENASLGTITLPTGSYQELSARLANATVHVHGEPVAALVPDAQCHTPMDMKIDPRMAQPRLTLYVWLEDALFEEGEVWHVRPAFSGSFMQANEAAFDQDHGHPRLSDPRCVPAGAGPPYA